MPNNDPQNILKTPETENVAYKRAEREYRRVVESDEAKEGAFNLRQVDGCWYKMLGRITGPRGTPYAGGTFLLDIVVPMTYPFKPPEVRFITKVWHPNVVYKTGYIHLDILRSAWTPALSLWTLLISIQALLSKPNHYPDDSPPDNFDEYLNMFTLTAQHWTNVYAGGPTKIIEFEGKVQQLMELGVDEDEARICLSNNDWDLDKAAERLEFT